MNRAEYVYKVAMINNAVESFNRQAETDKYNLTADYANVNNPHTKGDLIESKVYEGVRIKIEDIKIGISSEGTPCCIYIGQTLRKDLNPTSNGGIVSIWQHQIK